MVIVAWFRESAKSWMRLDGVGKFGQHSQGPVFQGDAAEGTALARDDPDQNLRRGNRCRSAQDDGPKRWEKPVWKQGRGTKSLSRFQSSPVVFGASAVLRASSLVLRISSLVLRISSLTRRISSFMRRISSFT